MQKPVQVLEISSQSIKEDVVMMDKTPPMKVIPTIIKPRDVTSTESSLPQPVQVNSHLDFQPELNTLENV